MATAPFKRFSAEDYRQAQSWFSNDFLGNMNIMVDGLNGVIQNGIPLINGIPPVSRQLVLQSNSVARWAVGADGTGENNNNSGSNFAISRYSDSGSYLDTPININRQTGTITLNGTVNVPNYQPETSPVNGGNETTIPLFGGYVLKLGSFVCTLVNDGVGNAIGTVVYSKPFPHGLLTLMATNGDVFAAGTRIDLRVWNNVTYFDFLAASGVIGNPIRINWMAFGS